MFQAQLEESVEQGFDVLGLVPPFEEIVDCDFGGEVFGEDHAHVGVKGPLVLGGLGGILVDIGHGSSHNCLRKYYDGIIYDLLRQFDFFFFYSLTVSCNPNR